MNEIYWIRHASTAGNRSRRYVGRTDEPALEEALRALSARRAPAADMVAISPLCRCRQTAETLYPQAALHVVEDFRECDFGDFEGKNFSELSANPAYQAWVDSNGTLPFPHGESPQAFRARCTAAFLCLCERLAEGQRAALIVHGGTIMAVLEALARPQKNFYDWHVENGQGLASVWDGTALTVRGEIWR